MKKNFFNKMTKKVLLFESMFRSLLFYLSQYLKNFHEADEFYQYQALVYFSGPEI